MQQQPQKKHLELLTKFIVRAKVQYIWKCSVRKKNGYEKMVAIDIIIKSYRFN